METFSPLFAAGFAVQQLLELLAPWVTNLFGEAHKRQVLGAISFLAGLTIAGSTGLRVLQTANSVPGVDLVVTALILSAGTEGANSVLKYVKYLKEDKKGQAARTLEQSGQTMGIFESQAEAALAALRAERSGGLSVSIGSQVSKPLAVSHIEKQ